MTEQRPDTIERESEKLYLTDEELIRRLGVPRAIAKAKLSEYESKRDFPKKDERWGDRRYWPAVAYWIDQYERKAARRRNDGEEKLERVGHVYFLASSTHIKIGFTAHIKKRLEQMKTGNAEKLVLLKTIPNVPARLERALHKKFAALRVRGEWFRREPELEEFIRDAHLRHWRKELLP